jgi:hypothetical protein
MQPLCCPSFHHSPTGAIRRALRAWSSKASLRTIDLGPSCYAGGGPSLADDKDRFLAACMFILDAPIYQGWTITLTFNQVRKSQGMC